MITNKLLKDNAFNITIDVIEENYKFDIEEIFDNIKKNANSGKFYLRYYILTDDIKVHSLEYYMKAMGYLCSSNYSYRKDSDGKVIYDNDVPAKDSIWLDIWWSK